MERTSSVSSTAASEQTHQRSIHGTSEIRVLTALCVCLCAGGLLWFWLIYRMKNDYKIFFVSALGTAHAIDRRRMHNALQSLTSALCCRLFSCVLQMLEHPWDSHGDHGAHGHDDHHAAAGHGHDDAHDDAHEEKAHH